MAVIGQSFAYPTTNTLRYSHLSLDAIKDREFVIFAKTSSEDRGHLSLWDEIKTTKTRNFIEVSQISKEEIEVSVNGEEEIKISIVDENFLQKLFENKNILIDISGFSYTVWAPLFRVAYKLGLETRILYAEPESYKLHKNPSSSTLFDLSTEFEGSSPLPGFAQLAEPDGNLCIFVALLGFEGNRPRTLIYPLDPPPTLIPVVGIPGFQIEFPAYAITCNQELLDEYRAHSDIRFSRASCPFDVYQTLCEIRKDYPGHYMYLAPVGTKPHGLGAVLYSIVNSTDTELVYDHPVRKEGRTQGIGTIHLYDFGRFDGY